MLPPEFKRWPLATFLKFTLGPDEVYEFNNDGRNTSVASYLTAGRFASVVNTTTGDEFEDSPWLEGEPSLWTVRFEPGRFQLTAGPDGAEWVCLNPAGRRIDVDHAHLPPQFTLEAGTAAFIAKGWARVNGVTRHQLECFVATNDDRTISGASELLLVTRI
jgi:hypothetical protein